LFCLSAASAATIGGNISGNLAASGSPYLATSQLTIPSGQTLTIQPGVVLLMSSGVGLTVNGTLDVLGTVSNPVIFTSSQDVAAGGAGVGAAGQWTTLAFSGAGSGGQLSNAVIRYGQEVSLTASSPQFTGVLITSMSLAAMSIDPASFPTASGLTATGNAMDGIDVRAGTMVQSGAWDIVGVPYVIRGGEVQIGSGSGTVNLTIAPGAVVKLSDVQNGNTLFYVLDTLTAVGTPSAPIIFTSIRDSTVGGAQQWTSSPRAPRWSRVLRWS